MDRRPLPAPPASPDHQPEECPLPPPTPPLLQSEKRSWLSGLVSGAGKFISFVFDSDSDLSSSFSASVDEDYEDDGCIEGEDATHFDSENGTLNQRATGTQQLNGWLDGSLAIISEVETKCAIEQLILQETFTRDECNKLVGVMKSRVVDIRSEEAGQCQLLRELPKLSFSNTISCQGVSRCLDQSVNPPDTILCSSSSLNGLSPELLTCKVRKHDLSGSAASETRKWLDSEMLLPCSKSLLDYGVLTLNKNMPQSGFENAVGSPVDVAKLYMQSLFPKKPQQTGSSMYNDDAPGSNLHSYTDEATYKTTCMSSKIWKRKHFSSVSWETSQNVRRVRLKSMEKKLNISDLRKDELSPGYLEQETCHVKSASDQREILPGCLTVREALRAKEESSIGVLRHYVEREGSLVVRNPLQADSAVLCNDILDSEAVFHAVEPTKTLTIIRLPSESTDVKVGSDSKPSDPAIILPAGKKDNGESIKTEELLENISIPVESHLIASMFPEGDGDLMKDLVHHEQTLPAEVGIKCSFSPSAVVKAELYVETKEGPSTTGKGELVKGSSEVIQGNLHELNNDIPVHSTDTPGFRPNGPLIEPKAQDSKEKQSRKGQTKVRRSVAKPRRGKGR